MLKKFLRSPMALIGLIVAIMAISTGFLLATSGVTSNGAFYTTTVPFDSATANSVGGQVRPFVAADSLLNGDVVYYSGVDVVAKSSTLSTYNALAGVVVGGQRIGMNAQGDSTDLGTLVATQGQYVWVLRSGRAWMRNDANGTLTAGNQVIPSDATAGRIEVRTTAIDTNFRVIGKAVTTRGANGYIPIDVSIK